MSNFVVSPKDYLLAGVITIVAAVLLVLDRAA